MTDTVTTISVGGEYDVVIGHDLLRGVGAMLRPGVQRVLLVHPASMAGPAQTVADALRALGHEVTMTLVPDAEGAKTAAVAAGLWGLLGREGFTRSDAVVAVGGGSVTDVAGFVAATWLRGVQVVQVPTTLLAMVDAAVGGKTGINTAEGKNLVGSFHPPQGVIVDLDLLATLPREDYVAGLAEVVKAGFIADPVILDLVQADPSGAGRWDGPHTVELLQRAVAVKAEVVSADPTETSLREILNYGHTFAHAIEHVDGFRRRHGEAVAVGMVYAAELAAAAGVLSPEVVGRHRSVLTAVGLPTTYPPGRWEVLLTAMRRDKKTRGSVLRFVVLQDIARPVRLEGPDEELLRAAYAAVTG